ncbi:hypothetical protein D3C80_831720 [compost metagenome]
MGLPLEAPPAHHLTTRKQYARRALTHLAQVIRTRDGSLDQRAGLLEIGSAETWLRVRRQVGLANLHIDELLHRRHGHAAPTAEARHGLQQCSPGVSQCLGFIPLAIQQPQPVLDFSLVDPALRQALKALLHLPLQLRKA